MKAKVLIYTDCFIYGGSERLMASLMRNEAIAQMYDIHYSYRSHKLYREGLIEEFGTAENDHIKGVKIISTDTFIYLLSRSKCSMIYRIFILMLLAILRYCVVVEIYNFIKLRSLIKREKPDILHINNGGYPAALSCRLMVFAAQSAGCRNIIFQVNNMAIPNPNIMMSWMDRLLYKRVKKFITASGKARETLSRNRDFALDKIVQIPNSVTMLELTKNRESICQELNIPLDGFIICEVAFIEYRKGQHLLIKALDLMREANPDLYANCYLVLVGSGPLEHKVRKEVEEKDMSEHIIMTGYSKNVSNYISACDLFILPSIADEDMPLVILIAMSLGKRIISTNFAGIKEEIEHGVSGVLLEPDEKSLPQELFENIVEMYHEQTDSYGVKAKERFNSLFSAKCYSDRINELYQSVNE